MHCGGARKSGNSLSPQFDPSSARDFVGVVVAVAGVETACAVADEVGSEGVV